MDKEEKYTDSDGQVLNLRISDVSETKCYRNSKNQLHRLNGPAIEYLDGSYIWVRNDRNHRIGGPTAYSKFTNYFEWWMNGKQVNVYYIYG